jgi:hypothetical protein
MSGWGPWKHTWTCVLGAAAAILIAEGILLALGRPLWRTCGSIRLWTGDAWGPENSQQFTDPYTFTHITHGILLYALMYLVARRRSVATRGVIAVALEAGWEVVENTDWVIDRYRDATLALGYYGDSVINSTGDILACAVGFALAARLPTRVTVVMVVLLELGLTIWIRDSLLLEVLMLVAPMQAIKTWQLGG